VLSLASLAPSFLAERQTSEFREFTSVAVLELTPVTNQKFEILIVSGA
jgi:hypothetical protein